MFKYVSPMVTSVSLTQISLTQQQSRSTSSVFVEHLTHFFLLSASLIVVKNIPSFRHKR